MSEVDFFTQLTPFLGHIALLALLLILGPKTALEGPKTVFFFAALSLF